MRIKLTVGDQKSHGLDGIDEHGNIGGVGAYSGKLAVTRTIGSFHKMVANLSREHESVGHIFPIRSAKNKCFQIVLHVIEYFGPIPVEGFACPEMGMKLDVFDAANVASPIDKNAATKNAAVYSNDPVTAIFGGSGADAIVAVDQGHVRDGNVEGDFTFVCLDRR